MHFADIEPYLPAGIIFQAFLILCGCLLEGRFTKNKNSFASIIYVALIIALQASLFLSGQDKMLVLAMLPLTAYLPVIIGVHMLSGADFFQTITISTIGLYITYLLTSLEKILAIYLDSQGSLDKVVNPFSLLMSACVLLVILFRYVRQEFRIYVLHNDTNWLLLCFTTIMIFLLFSYLKNSTVELMMWLLIFLTAVCVSLVIARTQVSATAAALCMQEEKQAMAAQLHIQRREYEDMCKKMEIARTYRHDMRHHLMVLRSLAGGEDNEQIVQYISELDDRMVESERKTYCENSTVNAVLYSYIGQAKQFGIAVRIHVQIPSQLPFDELDLCVVLANALENAVNACQNNKENKDQYINLVAVFEDTGKFIVSVDNPCEAVILFDREGFPAVPRKEGHGIGLKSVRSITEKYNGLIQCECKESIFRLKVMLFDSKDACFIQKEKMCPEKAVTSTSTGTIS